MASKTEILPKGVCDGVPYEGLGEVLSRYGAPFGVYWSCFPETIGHFVKDRSPMIRLHQWWEIRDPSGELMAAGGFPSQGAAQVVADHWTELRDAYLSRGEAARFIDDFFEEQRNHGNEWGIEGLAAPDWFDAEGRKYAV